MHTTKRPFDTGAVTNKKPTKREPSHQMKGSDKPEILVRRWGPDEWKADLARRKARHGSVHTRAKQVVTDARRALQEEINRLKAENKALRAKQAVAHARTSLQEEITRLKAENEALRKQPKVPKARKSKAEKSDRLKQRRGRVRKKKRKRGLLPKPRVISTPMGGQPGFKR